MISHGRRLLLCALTGGLLSGSGCQESSPPARLERDQPLLEGRVLVAGKPVSQAEVRWAGQANYVLSDRHGHFTLPASTSPADVLTVWKLGHWIEVIASRHIAEQPVVVTLRPIPGDHEGYRWIDPRPEGEDAESCGRCHAQIYDQWSSSGHADSATNRRFLNLYTGADWHGQPDTGWSLLRDHPDGASVCAACHAPAMDFRRTPDGDLREVQGVATHGVHCDFCHKVQDVAVEDLGLAHGRFGMQLVRPAEEPLFFGPLKDAVRGKESYAPVYEQSHYCAACHEGVVFGVHVYSTYSEWLDSPARSQGQTCQSCHMRPSGLMTNIAPGNGGIERDPQSLASHEFLPAGRETMLKRAIDVRAEAATQDQQRLLEVRLTARDVGHYVPTGFIDRHLLLVAEPMTANDQPLPPRQLLREGPVLPAPAGEDLQGQPGRLFARVLADDQGLHPVPFWLAVQLVEDTRLRPEQTVTTQFVFASDVTRVRIRLLYRRFWQPVAQQKRWPDDTITVFDETVDY